MGETFILPAEHLDRLVQLLLQSGHRVLGPVLSDQAIIYDEIHSAADLPRGWTDEQEKGYYRVKKRNDRAYFGYAVGPHSWKKYLHLPRRMVWHARKTKDGMIIDDVPEEPRLQAFLAVRSCELHAITVQDHVFSRGEYQNDSYQSRRERIFIVAVNCTSAAATCFCSSMQTGPGVTLDNDLSMTEIVNEKEHFFFLRAGSEKGRKLLQQLPVEKCSDEMLQRESGVINNAFEQMQRGPRHFDNSNIKDLLYRNYAHPEWDKVAERCLSCANCTLACPTCFCSTVEDVTDLSGEHAERWERWDSCFTSDFSHLSGGPVRSDTRSRYRQWMTHKLATWIDQFGESGCVGCGRCIAWCPVGIDITEQLQRLRETV